MGRKESNQTNKNKHFSKFYLPPPPLSVPFNTQIGLIQGNQYYFMIRISSNYTILDVFLITLYHVKSSFSDLTFFAAAILDLAPPS